MIDKRDGNILLDHQFSIGSRLSLEEFALSNEFGQWERINPYVYRRNFTIDGERQITLWVMFDGFPQHVSRCEISFLLENNDEVIEKVFLSREWHEHFLQRKRVHD